MSEADLRPERPRIFGIGLNKTGTSSFHEAMTMLGFESLHWGGPVIRRKVEAALDAGQPLLANLDQRIHAFSDIEPMTQNFDLLDVQYPGSRFVLTVRPIQAWLASRRRHVENNVRRKAAGEYHGIFLEVDEDRWRQEWELHVGRVRCYFAGRDDFLEIELTKNSTWLPLCTLLSTPEPTVPFPWVNRGTTYEPAPQRSTDGGS